MDEAIKVIGVILSLLTGLHGWRYKEENEGQITSESMEKHVYLLSENL
jgi:hypothetical protein